MHSLNERLNRVTLFWTKQCCPYLNIVTTSLRVLKSLEGIWFSWISQTEGTPGQFSISEGGTRIFSPSSASTWTGNSFFQDHILLDSTNWAYTVALWGTASHPSWLFKTKGKHIQQIWLINMSENQINWNANPFKEKLDWELWNIK